MLKPALRRLWRDASTLQLGIDPRHAVVVSGIGAADRELLSLLDGTREVEAAIAESSRRGGSAERATALVTLLRDAAVLEDADVAGRSAAVGRIAPDQLSLSLCDSRPGGAAERLAARRAAFVEVLGAGRVGATLSALLSAAGVGRVTVDDPALIRPADLAPGGLRGVGVHHRRGDAANALVASVRTAQPVRTGGDGRVLVVLSPAGPVVPPEWLMRVRARPHLPVAVRETSAVIGPLVLPGVSPCLRCLELARADRDPAWPVLAAQLVGDQRAVEPCDIALASAAAGLTAMHALAWLDSDRARGAAPASPLLGGVLEISLIDLSMRRRTVVAHPDCGCTAAALPALAS
jgi:bacteriocin biosynthesis cyclodehydratase domain-containing protein